LHTPLSLFNSPPTPEFSPLSLHDALPISRLATVVDKLKGTHKSWWECDTGIAFLVSGVDGWRARRHPQVYDLSDPAKPIFIRNRSEEHTSELQSLTNLVCRLLLEKKNKLT